MGNQVRRPDAARVVPLGSYRALRSATSGTSPITSWHIQHRCPQPVRREIASCRATNRLRTTTSREVLSDAKESTLAGNTARDPGNRVLHGRDFLASTALSTTRGRQYAGSAELLDRPEIQILQNRPRLPTHESAPVAHHDLDAVAKDPIGDCWRRLVENHEIDGRSGSASSRETSWPMSCVENRTPGERPMATSTSLPGWTFARACDPKTSA